MKIRKIYQGNVSDAKLLNEYSESKQNGYCADYINKMNKYSTDEAVIGEYLGKPLYRKIISKTNIPANTTTNVSHGINNLKDVIDIKGSVIIDYDTTPYKRRWPLTRLMTQNVQIQITSDYLQFISTNANVQNVIANVIIEYTKTTD